MVLVDAALAEVCRWPEHSYADLFGTFQVDMDGILMYDSNLRLTKEIERCRNTTQIVKPATKLLDLFKLACARG